MLEGAGAQRPTFPFPQLRCTDRQISRYAVDAPTREESARTDSLSSALSRVHLLPSYAGSESHSKETRGTVAHATNLFSTVRCRLHIDSHMGVLDLRWYSTLRIGEEPSPLGRAEPYLITACPWPRTAHSRQGLFAELGFPVTPMLPHIFKLARTTRPTFDHRDSCPSHQGRSPSAS
jgi:hypothetical protein